MRIINIYDTNAFSIIRTAVYSAQRLKLHHQSRALVAEESLSHIYTLRATAHDIFSHIVKRNHNMYIITMSRVEYTLVRKNNNKSMRKQYLWCGSLWRNSGARAIYVCMCCAKKGGATTRHI